jgi:hypothetical protein
LRKAERRSCSSVFLEVEGEGGVAVGLGREDERGVDTPEAEAGVVVDRESDANCSDRALPDPEAAQKLMYRLTIRLK